MLYPIRPLFERRIWTTPSQSLQFPGGEAHEKERHPLAVIAPRPIAAILALSILGPRRPQGAVGGAERPDPSSVASSANWTKDIDKAARGEIHRGNRHQGRFPAFARRSLFERPQGRNSPQAKDPTYISSPSGAGMIEFQPEQHAVGPCRPEPWVARYTDWAKARRALWREGRPVQYLGRWDGWALLYNPEIFKKAGINEGSRDVQGFREGLRCHQGEGGSPRSTSRARPSGIRGCGLNALGAAGGEDPPAGLYANLNANKAAYASQKGFENGLAQLKALNDNGVFSGRTSLDNTWENSYQAHGFGGNSR